MLSLWSWYQPKQRTCPGIAGMPCTLYGRWQALSVWSIWKGLGRGTFRRLAYLNFKSSLTKIQEYRTIYQPSSCELLKMQTCLRLSSRVRREWHCSQPCISYCWRPVSSTISHLFLNLQSVNLLACSLDASPVCQLLRCTTALPKVLYCNNVFFISCVCFLSMYFLVESIKSYYRIVLYSWLC